MDPDGFSMALRGVLDWAAIETFVWELLEVRSLMHGGYTEEKPTLICLAICHILSTSCKTHGHRPSNDCEHMSESTGPQCQRLPGR